MSKKPKPRPNSRNKSNSRQESCTPITPNPFLNFFLTKCGVRTNSKLHKFAKAISNEWTNMNYHEKSPYYQLADKARTKRLKLLTRTGLKDHKTKEETKSVTFETKASSKNEKVSSKKSGSLSSHFEYSPKDEIQIENKPIKVLENWLAETEFVTPQTEVEDKGIVEEIKPSNVVSEHVSIDGSFHSMQNNCCSQVDIM